MGTNYYWHENPPCEKCGHAQEKIHIGKSSGGWCFSLHVYPTKMIHDLADWSALFSKPDSHITNEYGETISKFEMLDIIVKRSREERWDKPPFGYLSWLQFHQSNHSEQGPNGLVRFKVDGARCIKHGMGTWDCFISDFS